MAKRLRSVATSIHFIRDKQGLSILDAADPIHPVFARAFTTTNPKFTYTHGSVLYVADMEGGLKMFDITNPLLPVPVGKFKLSQLDGVAEAACAWEGISYIFITNLYTSYMYIVDTTDPKEPFGIGKMDLQGEVTDCLTHDNRLFVLTTKATILTFDITNPRVFNLRSITPTGDIPSAVSAFMEFIYVAVGTGIRAYLVLNPDNLEEALRLDVDSRVNDILWYRGYVFAAADKGLVVVDVRDPRKGSVAAVRGVRGIARSLAVVEFMVYVSDDMGLTIVNGLPEFDPYWKLPTRETTHRELAVTTKDGSGSDVSTETESEVSSSSTPTPPLQPSPPPYTPEPVSQYPEILPTHPKAATHPQLFPDYPESRLTNVPSFFLNATLNVPAKIDIPEGTELKLTCHDTICDYYILLEHCLPCSHSTNGGLPHLCLNQGWAAVKCAPGFQATIYGDYHPMAMFYKRLYEGEIEQFPPLKKQAKRVVFASVDVGYCTKFGNPIACRTAGAGCQWDGNEGGCLPSQPVCVGKRKDIARLKQCTCLD
eukprot:TRINITY_DN2017_c0_g1_i1.p1 TRINITY_DN2017_c0_g1~~TRINITY_DN2017_c0_g1_i1.p1  ORF type:complete len:595 (+),score=71.25 TRINITY_DN2017_c0_g1_i1:169-1785(+)